METQNQQCFFYQPKNGILFLVFGKKKIQTLFFTAKRSMASCRKLAHHFAPAFADDAYLNTFKHGISTTKRSKITISIKQKENTLYLQIRKRFLKCWWFWRMEIAASGLKK